MDRPAKTTDRKRSSEKPAGPWDVRLNSTLRQSSARRLLIFKWILCAAVLSELAITPKLWTSDRAFPTVPVVAGIPDLPQPVCFVLVALFVAGVLGNAILPKPRAFSWAVAALGASLVLFDINRLQPWFYQYLLMFVAIGFVDWTEVDSRRSKAVWASCCFLIAGVYLWSGSHKLNLLFATETFPFLLKPLGGFGVSLGSVWWMAPVLEMGTGALLLFPRTRLAGVVGAVAMHGFLLGVLGPFGLRYNSSVWPWNFWMAAMAIVLFVRTKDNVVLAAWPEPIGKAVLLVLGILPAFNYVDRWDGFLSASYYSGKLRDGWIYLSEEGFQRLPEAYRTGNTAVAKDPAGPYRLDITAWAAAQINVPPYAEPRTYVGMVRKLEEAGVPPSEVKLAVRDWPRLSDKVRRYSVCPVD